VTDSEERQITVRKEGYKSAQSTRAKGSSKAPKAAAAQGGGKITYDKKIKHGITTIYLCQVIVHATSYDDQVIVHATSYGYKKLVKV
jgi:hypothetical protein